MIDGLPTQSSERVDDGSNEDDKSIQNQLDSDHHLEDWEHWEHGTYI
jgi:hypothetical protein